MIKTCVSDLKQAINNGTSAISTYQYRPGLLECEEDFYLLEEHKVRFEIVKELARAKKLLRTRKGWRWEIIKSTNGNPIKLLFIVLAWWRNFKIKSLWQLT